MSASNDIKTNPLNETIGKWTNKDWSMDWSWEECFYEVQSICKHSDESLAPDFISKMVRPIYSRIGAKHTFTPMDTAFLADLYNVCMKHDGLFQRLERIRNKIRKLNKRKS